MPPGEHRHGGEAGDDRPEEGHPPLPEGDDVLGMAEVVAEAALHDVVEAGPEQAHDDRPGDQPVDRRPVDPVAAEVGHDRDPVAHVEGHGVHDAVVLAVD